MDAYDIKKIAFLAVTIVVFIFLLLFSRQLVEIVDANELVVLQKLSGNLATYSQPGPIWQGLGKITSYLRRDTYDFEIQVRFNDGGHGTMKGSVQFELPVDETNLIKLHKAYGSQEGVKSQLVQKVVDKSVYMTGPLMSSTESYAARRNYLINYVEDQIANGVYRTFSHDVQVDDPITGQKKTVTNVDIVMNGAVPQRQEAAALQEYGIRTSNFSIKQLNYEETVEKQIQQQQQIAMSVQTSIANAKQAEQRKITTEENGKADAAKAKWDQEVIKAKLVTEAEAKKEVAVLDAQAAEQYKRKMILIGEGDAENKRLIMNADGALEKKLAAYERVQGMWAQAFSQFGGSLVPSVQMGGSGTNGNAVNNAQNLLDMIGIKAAKDLALDMSVPNRPARPAPAKPAGQRGN